MGNDNIFVYLFWYNLRGVCFLLGENDMVLYNDCILIGCNNVLVLLVSLVLKLGFFVYILEFVLFEKYLFFFFIFNDFCWFVVFWKLGFLLFLILNFN